MSTVEAAIATAIAARPRLAATSGADREALVVRLRDAALRAIAPAADGEEAVLAGPPAVAVVDDAEAPLDGATPMAGLGGEP